MAHFLIIKYNALGDVVRTSYVTEAIRKRNPDCRIAWLTSPAAVPLLRFNPHIDDLWTSFEQAAHYQFDHVFSLDDESEIVNGASGLRTEQLTGASLLADGTLGYTDDSAAWFDMGLLSRHGKEAADAMKRDNQRSHAEIFSQLFGVDMLTPGFWGHARFTEWAKDQKAGSGTWIGINPYAGGRWPAKELRAEELETLVRELLSAGGPLASNDRLVLLGGGGDRERNIALAESVNSPRILVPNTDDSVLRLAAIVGNLDYLVTSDSLALHLGIAQQVPFLAFFSPTSAAEIDTFGFGVKVISTADDYCSYRKDADNRSITAARILAAGKAHRPDIFPANVSVSYSVA